LETILFADLPNPERGSPRDLRMEFFYRGYIELKRRDSQAAIGHFKAALKHLPPSSGIDLHEDCLANAYLELGMVPNAIAEYQRILKLNQNYPLAYFHLGLSYQRIGDRVAANTAFQHFLEANLSSDQDSPPVLEAKRYLW
jgi:tetratricopeptide (TPR) repeat protein